MPYDVPHAVSPGLWALAWKRLRADGVAMVSLAIAGGLVYVSSGYGVFGLRPGDVLLAFGVD